MLSSRTKLRPLNNAAPFACFVVLLVAAAIPHTSSASSDENKADDEQWCFQTDGSNWPDCLSWVHQDNKSSFIANISADFNNATDGSVLCIIPPTCEDRLTDMSFATGGNSTCLKILPPASSSFWVEGQWPEGEFFWCNNCSNLEGRGDYTCPGVDASCSTARTCTVGKNENKNENEATLWNSAACANEMYSHGGASMCSCSSCRAMHACGGGSDKASTGTGATRTCAHPRICNPSDILKEVASCMMLHARCAMPGTDKEHDATFRW